MIAPTNRNRRIRLLQPRKARANRFIDTNHGCLVGADSHDLGAVRRPCACVDGALVTLKLADLGGGGRLIDKGLHVRADSAEFGAVGRIPDEHIERRR